MRSSATSSSASSRAAASSPRSLRSSARAPASQGGDRPCYDEWLGLFEQLIVDAKGRGQLAADVDPVQLAFELDAILYGANALFVLKDDPRAFDRARTAIRERLDASRLTPRSRAAPGAA